MKATFADLGHSSHQEAFFVFLVFGLCLGGIAAAFELRGLSTTAVMSVAKEALSLSIFLLLCSVGLVGTLVASWSKLPAWIAKILHFCCLPALRAGVTAGFIASGITIGLGSGGWLLFAGSGVQEQANSALRLVAMGTLLLLIIWPFIYLAAEVLGVTTSGLKLVAFVYAVGMSVVLMLAEPLGFWSGVGVFAAAICVQFWLRLRRRRAQQSVPPDVPAAASPRQGRG